MYINDKKEYGTIRTTIRKQQATTKGNNNKIDSVYSAKNYYLYEDNGFDNYKITTKIPIEGNEELITYIESEVKNGTYNTTETVDSIIETLYNGRKKYNTDNVDVEGRTTAMEDGGLYSEKQRGGNERFNNKEGYGNSKTGELDNSSFYDDFEYSTNRDLENPNNLDMKQIDSKISTPHTFTLNYITHSNYN